MLRGIVHQACEGMGLLLLLSFLTLLRLFVRQRFFKKDLGVAGYTISRGESECQLS